MRNDGQLFEEEDVFSALFEDSVEEEKHLMEVPEKKTALRKYVGKLSTGRIVACVLMGILFSLGLAFLVFSLYTNQIRYPSQMVVEEEMTGRYALGQYLDGVREMRGVEPTEEGEQDLLQQEAAFANKNENILAFQKAVVSTIEYIPDEVNALNKYGNTMIDRGKLFDEDDDTVVRIQSYLAEDEELTFKVIDYANIVFNENIVSDLMKAEGLKIGDVDYQNKLVNVFCKYIVRELENLPVKEIRRVPEIVGSLETGYTVLKDEDIFIDSILFSGLDFYKCINNFSKVAGEVTGGKMQETADWKSWNSLGEEAQKTTIEPPKYGRKETMVKNWCGVYYLSKEKAGMDDPYVVKLGDGTFDEPAAVGTPVVTWVFIDGEKYPVRVTLKEFGVSEKAIDWLESKDYQNRGFNLESEIQYCYCVFEITNLSDKTLNIEDVSALCDSGANMSSRTGTMYGLRDSLVLEPDQTGELETWNRSTELNKKFLVWGSNFDRKEVPVWFRVLAGDLEDESFEKGVHINTSRDD